MWTARQVGRVREAVLTTRFPTVRVAVRGRPLGFTWQARRGTRTAVKVAAISTLDKDQNNQRLRAEATRSGDNAEELLDAALGIEASGTGKSRRASAVMLGPRPLTRPTSPISQLCRTGVLHH